MGEASHDAAAVVISDLEGHVVLWDRAAEALYGWSAAEALGRPLAELTSTAHACGPEPSTAQAAQPARGDGREAQYLLRRRDGTSFTGLVTELPYHDASGKRIGLIQWSRPAEPVASERARLALLVELGGFLGASLDLDTVRRDVVGVLVPAFADLCSIVLDGEGGELRRSGWRAVDGATELLGRCMAAPLSPRVAAAWARALATGRAQLFGDFQSYLSADHGARDEYAVVVEQLGITSALVTPLIAHGKPAGVLSFGMLARSGRAFGAADAVLAEEIGRRVGQAIDNARVHTRLRESEARLDLALSTAPVRVFCQDGDLRYTLVQGGGRIAAENALGKTDREMLPPTAAAQLTALKREVLVSGRSARQTISLSLGGDTLHYDLAIEPLRDDAGRVIGVTGASWDVTEHHRLAARLATAEAQARRLIDDAPEPYFIASPDGRFVDVNAATCALLGFGRGELVGMPIAALIPAEDQPRLTATIAQLEPGLVSNQEWRLRTRAGELVDVEINATVLPDGHRQGFARDITARKCAERERERLLASERRQSQQLAILRESALAIAAIEERASEGVHRVLQRVADQARLLTEADYAAVGIGTDPDAPFTPWVWSGLAADHSDEIGRTPRPVGVLGWVARHGELLRVPRVADHPESSGLPAGHPPVGAFLGVPIVREGRTIGNLYLAKRPDGEPFTPEDQQVIGLLAGHAAIAIENARLLDEREAAIRAREELIAVVSHDLKSPLNAIELREHRLASRRNEPELVAHARSVRRSVAMMQRMIRGLLDSASLSRGKLRLDVEANDLRELVDEVVELLTPIAGDRDVRIDVRLPPLGAQRFDRERVLQTLYNLTGNAVKFTPAGGDVVISAELRERELVITVSDTGPGIAPDVLPRIFDRYFTTAKGHEGTGLGLFIAKGVAEAHGGRIWVDSVPGKGSAFHVALPAMHTTNHTGEVEG